MNRKSRNIAVKTIGAVLASVFALTVTAGPADAARTSTVNTSVSRADTGWYK